MNHHLNSLGDAFLRMEMIGIELLKSEWSNKQLKPSAIHAVESNLKRNGAKFIAGFIWKYTPLMLNFSFVI